MGAVTATDLLALYEFNGNANDSSGNGANGTLNGAATISAGGTGYDGSAGNGALDIGAAANFAYMSSTIALAGATTSDSMAVSYWQRNIGNGSGLNTTNIPFSMVSTSGGGTRGFQAHAPWSDGTLYFDHGGTCCGTANRLTSVVGTSLLDSWHHIVLQVSGGQKEIWIDGVLAASQATGAAVIPTFSGSTTIGAGVGGGNGFGGLIDEFAVWSAPLSQEQIESLAGGAPTQAILIPEPSSFLLLLPGALFALRRRRSES